MLLCSDELEALNMHDFITHPDKCPKSSLISVQSESRMARPQVGTTLVVMIGSSPSERRTPRSCRMGMASQEQQIRSAMNGFLFSF